jgi:outer membrane protein assembly factor BamB
MGMQGKRRRIAASAVMLAIFLVCSSFLGSYLLAKEVSAGGLDIEWKVALPDGLRQTMAAKDGSLIVQGTEGMIQDIARNGTVLWAHDAGDCRDLSLGPDGNLYYIEMASNGTQSVVCLLANGSLSWRFQPHILRDIQVGSDGNIYLTEPPGKITHLICLTPERMVAWIYTSVGQDLSEFPLAVRENGTLAVRGVMSNWSVSAHAEGSFVTTEDYLISLSSTGTVQWKKDILSEAGNFSSCFGPTIDANGTLQLVFMNGSSQTAVGLDADGTEMWTDHRNLAVLPWTEGSGNRVYLIENYEDQPWGYPGHDMTNISCRNTSTGKQIWQRTQEGSADGPLAAGNGSFIFLLNGELVCYSSDGSLEWNAGRHSPLHPVVIPTGGGRCGLLFAEGSTLTMIDGHGATQWQYQFDSPLESVSLGENGSYVAMTQDFVISIHKPVLSTTMNYFVVLLAIDLFITLMSVVRLVDMVWPQSKARID